MLISPEVIFIPCNTLFSSSLPSEPSVKIWARDGATSTKNANTIIEEMSGHFHRDQTVENWHKNLEKDWADKMARAIAEESGLKMPEAFLLCGLVAMGALAIFGAYAVVKIIKS